MSHFLNLLQINNLPSILPAMQTLSERVRDRVREEMKRQKMSQRDIAGLLRWSQSRVAHILTGRVEMGVQDLEGFGFALGLSLPELVRDRGMEFCAEMTPTEFRFHERVRALTQEQRDAILTVVGIKRDDMRSASQPRPPRKRK